ncbi:MAG: hypothetical protein P8L66_09915 [Rhodospirillaceae bacterium]|nr:hypothetical protein [Rhodospirillaceae bacterium]
MEVNSVPLSDTMVVGLNKGDHGHEGDTRKAAYANFVIAMMAMPPPP